MTVRVNLRGVDLLFTTTDQVFSPKQIDAGTSAMLSVVEFTPEDKVLDLGCGYGIVGILAAKLIGSERVVMVDVSPEAIRLSKLNAEQNGVGDIPILLSNGLENVKTDGFTIILSNPPYHEDFSVPRSFIEDGFPLLALGGIMVMVVKRLNWYKNKLSSIFGGVTVHKIDDYYVLTAEKRSLAPPARQKKPQNKKQAKREEMANKFKKRKR